MIKNVQAFIQSKQSVIKQLAYFGIVGCSAALVNFLAVVLLVEFVDLHPLVANIFAFAMAFNVSYFGHRRWTFGEVKTQPHTSWLRFLTVAVGSFLLNEGLYFVFLQALGLHYQLALVLVIVMVPPVTFVFSKFWAFRERG